MNKIVVVILVVFSVFLDKKNQNVDPFKNMIPIKYVVSHKNGKIKKFNFEMTDDCVTVEGIDFYKSNLSFYEDIYFGIENDSIYSLSYYSSSKLYSKNLFLVLNKNYRNTLVEPFGGHNIDFYRTKISNNSDTIFVFKLYEMNKTYDIEFEILDSIEVQKLSFSKLKGFTEIVFRDKKSDLIYSSPPCCR